MHPHQVAQIARTPGALAPYQWEAHYHGGGRLLEHDVDGHHAASEIDLDRLAWLTLLGHPDGPLSLVCHVRPQRLVLGALRRLALGTDAGSLEHTRVILFGYVYPDDQQVLYIDDAGRVGVWEEAVP